MSDAPDRTAAVERKTGETDVRVRLALDGSGRTSVETGVGFFNHMLELFGRHALFDLEVSAAGDVQVDAHHTVEDVGICLGQALASALGDKAGIRRFASLALPMDEALAQVSVDASGRPFLVWDVAFPTAKTGEFDAQLAEEFVRALVTHAGITLHVRVPYGRNTHHVAEAVFKALARVLREAVAADPRERGVPSTKGAL